MVPPPAALPPGASVFSEEHRSLQFAHLQQLQQAKSSWANMGAHTLTTHTTMPNNTGQLQDTVEREEIGIDLTWVHLGKRSHTKHVQGHRVNQWQNQDLAELLLQAPKQPSSSH